MAAQAFVAPAAASAAHLRATANVQPVSIKAGDFAKAVPPATVVQVLRKTVPAVTAAGLVAGAAAVVSARRRRDHKALGARRAVLTRVDAATEAKALAAKVDSKSSVITYVDGQARFVVDGPATEAKAPAVKAESKSSVITYVDGMARFVVDGAATEAKAPAVNADSKGSVITNVDGKARFVVDGAAAPMARASDSSAVAPPKQDPAPKVEASVPSDAAPSQPVAAPKAASKSSVITHVDGQARFVVDAAAAPAAKGSSSASAAPPKKDSVAKSKAGGSSGAAPSQQPCELRALLLQ